MTHAWFPSDGVSRRVLIAALAALLAFTTLVIIPGSVPAAGADDHSTVAPDSPEALALQAPPPVTPNPPLGDSCGIDIVLVMDSSGSIGGGSGTTNIKAAYNALLDGLIGTGSRAGVVDYDTASTIKVSPYSAITDATVNQAGGVFKTYIDSYAAGGWTNWDDALSDAQTATNPDLVVMLSDGNPNTVKGGSGGGATEAQAVEAAMVRANSLKAGGAHMLAVGIGSSLSISNLKQITNGASSITAPPTPINGSTIKTLDIISASLDGLEDAMKALASALCDGSVTVKKLVDGSAAAGWEFTATDQTKGVTDGSGEHTFTWDLTEAQSKEVTITELLQNGYILEDYSCTNQETGNTLSTTFTIGQGENVTCTFNNATIVESLTIDKKTNGEDDLGNVTPGLPLVWTYKVVNTGNVPLSGITVVDDQGVKVSCPGTTLEPGSSMTCSATGTATEGAYQNTGTADSNETGPKNDTSSYFGVVENLTIDKKTNGEDALGNVPVGTALTWTYKVVNTGNVPLSGITVVDDQGVIVTCPGTTLEPGSSMTCSATGTATEGAYQNTGTADSNETGPKNDTSSYFGEGPSISIEKSTNGEDADEPFGPQIIVGDPVVWEYVVTNTGKVALTSVAVTDDILGAVCSIGDLAVGEIKTCEASGVATAGQYANEGTVTGVYNDQTVAPDGAGTTPGGLNQQTVVTDTDMSHYFGAEVAASAQIGDTVWNDENRNGVQDNGEKGIAGAKVTLTMPDNSTVEAVTNSNGLYLFAGLEAGQYTAALVLSSIPAPSEGENKLTTAGSFTIQLAADQSYLEADFGVASELPKTGVSADNLALIALALLLAGGVAVIATRRKSEPTDTNTMA